MMTERENVLRVIQKAGDPEWVPYAADCFDMIFPSDVIPEFPAMGEGSGFDWFNCYWHFDPKTFGYCPVPGKQPVSDITKWRDQIQFPSIDTLNWEKGSQATLANFKPEEKVSYLFWAPGPWERLHALVGLEESLEALYTEPESVLELMEALTQHKLEVIEYIAEYYKPDMLCLSDDFAHQTSYFMSVDMLRKFVFPFEKRIGEALDKHGIIYNHHSCGKIDGIMGDIIDLGAKVLMGFWAPYNDVAAVEKQYSHQFTIDGGLDIQLLWNEDTTDEMVVAELRRCIDACAPYKNLIVNPGPILSPATRPERLKLIRDEVLDYGRDYWKRNNIK